MKTWWGRSIVKTCSLPPAFGSSGAGTRRRCCSRFGGVLIAQDVPPWIFRRSRSDFSLARTTGSGADCCPSLISCSAFSGSGAQGLAINVTRVMRLVEKPPEVSYGRWRSCYSGWRRCCTLPRCSSVCPRPPLQPVGPPAVPAFPCLRGERALLTDGPTRCFTGQLVKRRGSRAARRRLPRVGGAA